MTYNERVREIAEKMAERQMGKAWVNCGPVYRQHQIDGFMPYARIAVEQRAEGARTAFRIARHWVHIFDEWIECHLREQGLIPDSAQEGKPEPCPQELRCHTRNRHTVACECCNMGLLADKQQIKKCPEFPHFGASYPDARCIDGYLWDLDKCEDGKLYGGGDDPCPFCNTELYKEWCGWEDAREEKRGNILHHIDMLHKKYMPQQEGGKS